MGLIEPLVTSARERWLMFRNRLISNHNFQRWAADFVLTRPLARRRSRALFDLVAGFVYSQILAACVRLKLFELLRDGPKSISHLSGRVALDVPATERLVKAAASLELMERLPDGRYGLGHLGAALLGNPCLIAMIEHHALLYADLSDPVALLRGEVTERRVAEFWAYARNPKPGAIPSSRTRDYSALMASSQALIAGDVLDAYPLDRHRTLLDIGGGDGAFLAAVASRTSDLKLVLFDLPGVTAQAEERFAGASFSSRVLIRSGNFFSDPLPRGADIATLIRVLHDHDDAAAETLLLSVKDALPKDGVLIVAETMSETAGAAPMGDAYFGMYLAAMGSGRPRTADEICQMLRNAGFATCRLVATPTPMLMSLIVAGV